MRFTAICLLSGIICLSSCKEEDVLMTQEAEQRIPTPTGLEQYGPAGPPETPAIRDIAVKPDQRTEFTKLDVGPLKEVELPSVGLSFSVPEDWSRDETESEMRLAQFSTPEGGELVAFAFGSGQGGSAQENVARWLGQFGDPIANVQKGSVDGLDVTQVMTFGTYSPSAMMMGGQAPEAKPDWGLNGLVVEGSPAGMVFFRLTGPKEVISESAEEMETLAATLELEGDVSRAELPEGHPPIPMGTMPPGHPDIEEMTASGALPGVQANIPTNWKPEPVSSSMRVAQYEVASGSGGEPAEMVVFYFGEDGAGGAEENIARWVGQIRQGSHEEPTLKTLQNGPFNAMLVIVEGTYAPGAMGPAMPAPEPIKDAALAGAVVEGGSQGPLYFKMTGPRETVLENVPELQQLIATLEPSS